MAGHYYAFVDKRDLLAELPDDIKQAVRNMLVPLPHIEWAANMNNCQIDCMGYGTTICSVAMFNARDRLGMAQYISRMGLLINRYEVFADDSYGVGSSSRYCCGLFPYHRLKLRRKFAGSL